MVLDRGGGGFDTWNFVGCSFGVTFGRAPAGCVIAGVLLFMGFFLRILVFRWN